jgi:hypothetical protein
LDSREGFQDSQGSWIQAVSLTPNDGGAMKGFDAAAVAKSDAYQRDKINSHIKPKSFGERINEENLATIAASGKKKRRPNVGKKAGVTNKVESRFALILEAKKRTGVIRDYQYEGLSFKLPSGGSYKPDFVEQYHDAIPMTLIEIKVCDKDGKLLGRDRNSIERFRTCRKMYPEFNWVLMVEESKNVFDTREI